MYVGRKIGLIDLETGEILEDRVYFIGRKPTKIDKGFVKVFVAFLEDLVQDEKITGKASRLLLYAVKNADWNKLTVYLHYKEVCQELGVSKATFFNWLKDLLEGGYLERTAKPFVYKLKPYSFVKGSMSKVDDLDLDF